MCIRDSINQGRFHAIFLYARPVFQYWRGEPYVLEHSGLRAETEYQDMAGFFPAPVSYTHLDVYKRQGL